MWPALTINQRERREYHNKTTEAPVDLDKEDSLEKELCMLISRQQDARKIVTQMQPADPVKLQQSTNISEQF